MGSITYNFLANSILFNEKEIENNFASLTDNQLENELVDYRNFVLNNSPALMDEVLHKNSSLKVLSSIENIPFQTLKQSALYFDQFVIYDPLFPFTDLPDENRNVMAQYLGFSPNTIHSNREEIRSAVKLLKAITPMVAGDFVKMLPLSKLFEPPKQIPLVLPNNYYEDELPKEILKFCKERVILKSMKQDTENGGWKIMDNLDLTPGLYISFDGYDDMKGQIYHYQHLTPMKISDDGKVLFKIELAKYPLKKQVWQTWARQSINKSALEVVKKIDYVRGIADQINATYLTDNNFTTDLLDINLDKKKNTIANYSATQFINLELPFLDKVDVQKLMDIREFEADTFTNFRLELERQFRELRTISDPKELEIRKQNILHELGDIQVKKIDQKFRTLQKKGKIEGVIMFAGVAAAIQTGGFSLLASLAAGASGYKTFKDYKENLTENPSYLLWKTMKK